MQSFRAAVLLLMVFAAPSVHARDVVVDDVKVKVSPPPGYCEFDLSNKADKAYYSLQDKAFADTHIKLVAAFPDCKELQKIRQRSGYTPTTILFITRHVSTAGKADAKLLTDTCKDLSESGEKYASSSDTQQLVDKWFSGKDVGIKFLGILEDKSPNYCHAAILQKVKGLDGEDVKIAKIYTNALVLKSIFFIYSSSPYVDASSFPTGLANAKIFVSDFMSANAQ